MSRWPLNFPPALCVWWWLGNSKIASVECDTFPGIKERFKINIRATPGFNWRWWNTRFKVVQNSPPENPPLNCMSLTAVLHIQVVCHPQANPGQIFELLFSVRIFCIWICAILRMSSDGYSHICDAMDIVLFHFNGPIIWICYDSTLICRVMWVRRVSIKDGSSDVSKAQKLWPKDEIVGVRWGT